MSVPLGQRPAVDRKERIEKGGVGVRHRLIVFVFSGKGSTVSHWDVQVSHCKSFFKLIAIAIT